MAYLFTGFLTTSITLEDYLLRRWPQAVTRRFAIPFPGLIVSGPDNPLRSNDSSDELYRSFENDLPSWSREHPSATFVFVDMQCSAGWFIHSGYACRDGQVFNEIDGDEVQDWDNLIALLSNLGDTTGWDGYFEPFERGSWPGR